VAEAAVHEGLCRRISDSRGSMWPIQWFMRVYVAKSVVREHPCGRGSGSWETIWPSQWF
jgi:hypothetical protein